MGPEPAIGGDRAVRQLRAVAAGPRYAAGRRPAAFWTAPGFEISLVRTAQPEEGSWVSMAFDPQGRLTIAREDKGLLRMTLDAARREQSRRSKRSTTTCRNAAGCFMPTMRCMPTPTTPRGCIGCATPTATTSSTKCELLRQFPGGVGHGRNDLALGPDGMIYSIHGDSVDVPKDDIVDRTSPFREARRGQTTSEGYRASAPTATASSGSWSAAGLRNPFGIAFNPSGDAVHLRRRRRVRHGHALVSADADRAARPAAPTTAGAA